MWTSIKSCYRKIQPWWIWGLGAGFFLMEYFGRVDPSVIVPQLMGAFHVGAFELGSLSAFFYYPYVAMQLPVGALVDRYGPHRLLTVAAVVCSLACFLFAGADALWMAKLARALMGFSASFAFVGALKLATIWFEPRRLGLLAGLTQGMGMLGAAIGQGVFAGVVKYMGWRDTLGLIGTLLFILAVLIGVFVRDKRPSLMSLGAVQEETRLSTFEGLMVVFRNRWSWMNAVFAGLLYAPTAAFAELWGPSFMHRTYHLSSLESALAVSTIFIGSGVGGPLLGAVSDFLQRRRIVMFFSAFCSLVFISIVLYIPNLPISLLFIILFLYGVSNMGVAVAYAVAGELNPRPVAGVSIAFTNMASVIVGALLQPVIGWLIELHGVATYVKGAPIYTATDYRMAMLMLPFSLIFACLVVFGIRETHCKGR